MEFVPGNHPSQVCRLGEISLLNIFVILFMCLDLGIAYKLPLESAALSTPLSRTRKAYPQRLDKPLPKTIESKVRRWTQFAHVCASYGLGS